ncbi:MAG: AbrB/MazE/SpoVT family DNA-binding domain-containing protein [Thermofilum sp.]
MVEVVEIDASGRIYLPASVRRNIPWRRFIVRVEGDRVVLTPVRPAVEKYYGVAGNPAYMTAEEIDEAVERETKRTLEKDLR